MEYFTLFYLFYYFISLIKYKKNEVKRENLNSIDLGMRSKYTVQLVLKSGVLIANQIQKFLSEVMITNFIERSQTSPMTSRRNFLTVLPEVTTRYSERVCFDLGLIFVLFYDLKTGNGVMDFQEFVQFLSKKHQFGMDVNEAREAFRIFDRDDRGYVLTSELRQAFRRLGEEISESELDDILEDKYQAGNRKISFEGELTC